MTGSSPRVDTRKVKERRSLSFTTLAAVRHDTSAIETAHRAGTLRAVGNWTPGQILCHLASFIDYSFDGYPAALKKPPALLRWIFQCMKGRFLYKPLGAGIRIPGVAGGTVGADDLPFDQAMSRLRGALDRLEKNTPSVPNAVFGPLTHDEWINLQLRHCELHLSFLALK